MGETVRYNHKKAMMNASGKICQDIGNDGCEVEFKNQPVFKVK